MIGKVDDDSPTPLAGLPQVDFRSQHTAKGLGQVVQLVTAGAPPFFLGCAESDRIFFKDAGLYSLFGCSYAKAIPTDSQAKIGLLIFVSQR